MFIDENSPWTKGLQYRPEGPDNVSELRKAIFNSLGKMFGSPKNVQKAIRFDERPQFVVLRADLLSLQKCGVRLGIEGGMRRWLLIRARNFATVKIPISHFEADTILGNRWIEFKFRLVPVIAQAWLEAATNIPTGQAIERVMKLTDQPMRRVFITRGLNALADLSEKSPMEVIEAANTATSNCAVLARALSDPETITNIAPTDDPLAAAKLRGLETRENLLRAEGGTLTAKEVSKILGISRQAVDKRRQAGQLIGLTRGKRGYAYPMWQFKDGRTLPGLETVLQVLNRHDAWMQTLFMLSAHTDLQGRTPLTELREGHVDAVVSAAANYGEHGAA